LAGTGEHIGEGVAGMLDREPPGGARRHRHVEIPGVCRDTVDRPSLTPKKSTDHTNPSAVVVDYFRDVACLYVLIAWRGHLQR
jgi:hypothetical protein